jgi:hypothetical protein
VRAEKRRVAGRLEDVGRDRGRAAVQIRKNVRFRLKN